MANAASVHSKLPDWPPAEPAPDGSGGSTHLAFHPALLVPSCRIAKFRLETPVRAEGDEPLGLLRLMAAQNLLHRALQVVIAQQSEDTTKMVKRPLVRFQESLLRGVIIGRVERSATRHGAHRKVVNLLSLVPDLSYGFVPIDLGLAAAPGIDLRHERLSER